jgi:hypothetical protein
MLFAAYRALPRLSVPRHPPCALLRLTGLCFDAPRLHARVPHILTDLFTLQVLVTPFPLTHFVKSTTQAASVR